jgi:hypothetical protein
MSKAKKILLTILAIVVLAGGGFVWIMVSVSNSLSNFDSVAKTLITELAESGWSEDVIYKRAVPEFRADYGAKVAAVLPSYRRLGPLKAYKGIVNYTKLATVRTGTNYAVRANAEFENGVVLVTLGLIGKDGQYLLTGINLQLPPSAFEVIEVPKP